MSARFCNPADTAYPLMWIASRKPRHRDINPRPCLTEQYEQPETAMDDEEWNGEDRRRKPYEYQMRQIIQEELKPIVKVQADIQKKIDNWEFGSVVFRNVFIGAMSLIGFLIGLWEWFRAHVK